MISLYFIFLLECRIFPLAQTQFPIDVKDIGNVDLIIQDFSTDLMNVLNELSEH